MNSSLNSVALVFVAAFSGLVMFPHSDPAQQYRLQRGYGYWSEATEEMKTAYLQGYLDAETIYRSSMDEGLKPRCPDAGKQWIDDFEYKFPLLNAEIMKLQQGLDDFYKDDDGRDIGMFRAQRVVRLVLAGRPQSEVDQAKWEARHGAPRQ
jgi:hypothetical protein